MENKIFPFLVAKSCPLYLFGLLCDRPLLVMLVAKCLEDSLRNGFESGHTCSFSRRPTGVSLSLLSLGDKL